VSGPAGSLPAIQIHPTRRCNLRCLHCYSDSGPEVSEQLDAAVIVRAISDAADLGYRVMSVSGGEPLLYDALPEILRAVHDHGLATTVTTNGMLMDERRLGMIEPDADLIAISLDGIPESHAQMRGSPRAFIAMVDRLEGLRATRIPFGFIFTFTYHNVHELDWVANFAIEQGAKLLQIHPLEPVGRAILTLDGSVPDAQENACALVEAFGLSEKYGSRIQVHVDLATLPALHDHPEKVFACTAGLCEDSTVADLLAPIVLEASGIVAPMQYGFPREWCMGSVHDAPLRELMVRWLNTRYSAFREVCRGVRADALSRTDDMVFNWYERLNRAAARTDPASVVLPELASPGRRVWAAV